MIGRRHTNALVLIFLCNTFEDVWPLGPSKVRQDASSREGDDFLLFTLELLEHGNEGMTRAVFPIDARAVDVEFKHSILVLFGHSVHNTLEPFQGSHFSDYPVQVRPLCQEGPLLGLGNGSPSLDFVKHIPHNADQWSCSNA